MLIIFTLGVVIGCTLSTFAITWTLNRYMEKEDVNGERHNRDKVH